MIKNLINKILGKPSGAGRGAGAAKFGKRVEWGPQDHKIDPSLVDSRAADVVHTLKRGGYEAYIVGGAVRDLLLGLRPKDFDVATDATPEQVKGLFRRAFIIGRRFRIVHVVYGRGREHEVMEVSTFRAHLDNAAAEAVAGNEKTSRSDLAHLKHAVDSTGRVLRDNVWGPMHEDAARRDFTINAMYYDPQTQVLVDYHKGIEDARKKVIRMIGDPLARYREDPVRILRAIRFSAKLAALGFKLEPKTAKPLVQCQSLLEAIPPSRMFDEMLKLVQTGHSLASIAQLKLLGLDKGLYPLLDLMVAKAGDPLVNAVLEDTDRRVGEGKPVAPSFLLASVLWQDVRQGWERKIEAGQHRMPALQEAIDEIFDARIGEVSGRGKLGADMREIWSMQPRFEKRIGTTPFSLVDHPRFRAGFDFMRLRAQTGEIDQTEADWWQEFSIASDDLRMDMMDAVRDEIQKSKPRGPRRVKAGVAEGQAPRTAQPRGGQGVGGGFAASPPERDEGGQMGEVGEAGEGAGVPPRKRRRRNRRKPDGAGAPSDAGS
jgi:poly(A) polymerase